MKKKVLHVINSLTIGGAETLLANSLAPGGLNDYTDNYLVYFNKASYLLDIIDKDVKVFCLQYKGGLDIFRLLKELRSIITNNKIDIVHTHLTPAGLYIHLICPEGVIQVHTIHSTYSMDTETSPFKKLFDKKLYFNSKNCNIISLSNFAKEDFLTNILFKGKIFVLNNFVADKYFNLPDKEFKIKNNILRIVAAGTLKELKNFEFLLAVFEYLVEDEIYLDIYGEGDKSKYEAVIKVKNLKINMMGRVDDLAKVIQNYDLFIMPSKYEGFPLAVFEAMVASIPLMLSDIAPLKAIVKENALYFNLNEPSATAGLIQDIFQGKIDFKNMISNAKRYAAVNVKRKKYIENLVQVYDQL